ncbi:endonuclease domain-containing protein [Streptomyces sp. NPDC055025]
MVQDLAAGAGVHPACRQVARQSDARDRPVTMTAQEALEEVRRRDAVEREWLSTTTEGRPTFAEAEILDRRGIPSCHVWRVPAGEVPPHLSAIQALRQWQARACAMCSARRGRLLVDHCHQTGRVRGLLCTSCNTAEGMGRGGSFAAYRARPPAVMLGLEEQYGSAWDGFGA